MQQPKKQLMSSLNESKTELTDSFDNIKLHKPSTRFGPVTYLTKHQASGKLQYDEPVDPLLDFPSSKNIIRKMNKNDV